jgi:hypothetical protein
VLLDALVQLHRLVVRVTRAMAQAQFGGDVRQPGPAFDIQSTLSNQM